MASLADTNINPSGKIMFMRGFTNLTTEFAFVTPRLAPVIAAPVNGEIVAGTLIEGEKGRVRVETLRIGDTVQKPDGGLARAQGMDRRSLAPQSTLNHVPGGAPYTLIPAITMTADHIVRRHFPDRQVAVVTPLFADEKIFCPFLRAAALPQHHRRRGALCGQQLFPRLNAANVMMITSNPLPTAI